MFCRRCGTRGAPRAAQCARCGCPLDPEPAGPGSPEVAAGPDPAAARAPGPGQPSQAGPAEGGLYCPFCGNRLARGVATCASCGRTVPPLAPRPAASSLADDPAMRMVLPVGRSGLAIAAGYAGLFAFLGIFAPVALVLGILALRDLGKHPEKLGRGRAWFGVIAGGLMTALMVLAMLLIAFGN